MERLTFKDERGRWCVEGSNGIVCVQGGTGYVRGGPIDRLAAYEDAEEQGRIVVLPFPLHSTFLNVSGGTPHDVFHDFRINAG